MPASTRSQKGGSVSPEKTEAIVVRDTPTYAEAVREATPPSSPRKEMERASPTPAVTALDSGDTSHVKITQTGGSQLSLYKLKPEQVKHLLEAKLGSKAIQKIIIRGKTILAKINVAVPDGSIELGHQITISIEESTPTFKYVIKPVNPMIPDEVLSEELIKTDKGYKGHARIKNKNGLDTWAILVTTQNNMPSQVSILGKGTKIERYIQPVIQCNNCQKFGHVTKQCKSTCKTCRFCTGKHHHSQCKSENKTCANCGGPHSARYQGCPKYQEIQAKVRGKAGAAPLPPRKVKPAVVVKQAPTTEAKATSATPAERPITRDEVRKIYDDINEALDIVHECKKEVEDKKKEVEATIDNFWKRVNAFWAKKTEEVLTLQETARELLKQSAKVLGRIQQTQRPETTKCRKH